MKMSSGFCRDLCDQVLAGVYRLFPCLADPARRSSFCFRVALVLLHLVVTVFLFLSDNDLVHKTKQQPWYTALYVLLLVATLVQYFVTSCSSPGYVVDARRAMSKRAQGLGKESTNAKQPASSSYGSICITVAGIPSGRNPPEHSLSSWSKLVLDMYPPGTSIRSLTCSYCHIELPPRAKHCHDCDRCILQFDHHCIWLGTCIGQGNHCRFWWYLCEETALCLWTGILYIGYLKANISRVWWKDAIAIMLLIILSVSLIFLLLLLLFHSYLILTNQTTYELIRRRRIPYLRNVPERVYPFSQGIGRNIRNFCCAHLSIYSLERVPTTLELEEKSRPYRCLDFLTCRCC